MQSESWAEGPAGQLVAATDAYRGASVRRSAPHHGYIQVVAWNGVDNVSGHPKFSHFPEAASRVARGFGKGDADAWRSAL